MSIDLTRYNSTNANAEKRAIAVTAALSIIHAKAANSPEHSTIVQKELSNLSKYADQIQEALTVK